MILLDTDVLVDVALDRAEMAIRLDKAGWSNAEFWVRRQAAYDLA